MTIGIGIATNNGILLIADGRTTDEHDILSDETKKISLLRNNLAVIKFGVVAGTTHALSQFELQAIPQDMEALVHKIDGQVFESGNMVLEMVGAERTNARMKVGLVAGGIGPEGPFLAASLYGSLMGRPDTHKAVGGKGKIERMMLGGAGAGALAHLDSQLQALVDSGEIDSPDIFASLLSAARRTIRYAGLSDRKIGGRIQYLVMRKGEAPELAFIDSSAKAL